MWYAFGLRSERLLMHSTHLQLLFFFCHADHAIIDDLLFTGWVLKNLLARIVVRKVYFIVGRNFQRPRVNPEGTLSIGVSSP